MTNRSRDLNAGSTTEPKPQLTDEQWLLIADLFSNDPPGPAGGRPRVAPRDCVEGILWVLRSGARWKDLPKHFPSYPTCWRRLQEWTGLGLWQKAWTRLLRKLTDRGAIAWEESIADGMFSPAKKGAKALI
jgi:transposase